MEASQGTQVPGAVAPCRRCPQLLCPSNELFELREVELVGECSLNSKVRACSELWLMLCGSGKPAIASSS